MKLCYGFWFEIAGCVRTCARTPMILPSTRYIWVIQLDLSASVPQCLSVNTFLTTLLLSFIHHVFQDSTVGGHSVAEMERVVAAMRKVVERLQGENESLRRSAKQKGTSVTQLETENRRLKARQLSSDSIVTVGLIPSHQDSLSLSPSYNTSPFM